MKIFGTITLDSSNKRWIIECEPHVAKQLKRWFPRIDETQRGIIHLADTDANGRELLWITERFPMAVVPDDYLRARAENQLRTEAAVQEILKLDYAPPTFDLAIPARPYQAQAAHLLLKNGALLLADDLGLGKTMSAICAMADKRALPCVVVTMTHLPIQWRRELARFAPKLTVHVVKGGPVYDVRTFGRYPDVVIVPYSKLAKWATALAPHAKYVVFDEVQELRRNESQKYAAACELRENAAYTLGLTATPVMNYGGDFYNVMNVIKEDCLGTRVEFSREWATNDVTGMSGKLVIADPQALGTYMRTTGLMLRRQYGDAGIPTPLVETIVHEIECDEGTIEAAEGRASELARIILDQTAMGFDKLRASEELNHLLRQSTGIAKAKYVSEFVYAMVKSGEPVVLAGWHRAVYEIWLEELKELKPLMYTGSESPAQKQRMRDAFVEGKSDLLIMSLRSGAGLDGLQGRCRVAVFGELDWSPGIHKQLLGRLARFGQTKPVMGYYLTADCGSDPVVSDVLGLKAAQADGIMDPDKEVLEQQAVDVNRIKNLARAVLENMGRR